MRVLSCIFGDHKKRKKDLSFGEKADIFWDYLTRHKIQAHAHAKRTRKENRSARSSRAQSSDEEEDTHIHTHAHTLITNARA
jgi:hypothetical protein